jgi:beta-lactamase class C
MSMVRFDSGQEMIGKGMRLASLALACVLFATGTRAQTDTDPGIERIVARALAPLIPADQAGGVAAAVRVDRRTLFFNYGLADRAERRPVTSDSLFNLGSVRKVLDVTLLAHAVKEGKIAPDDPVAKYVGELQDGGYVRGVTLRQLATHTSGLLLPSDHPPWPQHRYNLAEFISALNHWAPEGGEQPGRQHIYSHAAFVLLGLALERRFATPMAQLISERVLAPLQMTSTFMPEPAHGGLAPAGLTPAVVGRAVQGYSDKGDLVGAPGDQQGYFTFPGTGQMFSSARDLAAFVAAQVGELEIPPVLRDAMQLTQQGMFRISPQVTQGLAWEINEYGGPRIIDKPGGLNNSSTYIGIVPERRLGVVILANRGNQSIYEIARHVLLPALAH